MSIAKPATTLFACAFLLAGCGSVQLPSSDAGVRQSSPVSDRKGLAKADLIYVSDADSEVTVYNLAKQTLVGVLTHFDQPMGECVDAGGDVYIADYSAEKIFEYAHGGAKPIKTLDDSPYTPYECAVDPTTGDLAVTNYGGTSKSGNVTIWPKGSGQPTAYADSALIYFFSCAYDRNGNLLLSGSPDGRTGAFAWLPHGGSQLIKIAIPGPKSGWTWYSIDGVQWDGEYFVLDYGQSFYRISVIHGLAYYIGDIHLTDYAEFYGPAFIYTPNSTSKSQQILGGETSTSSSYAVGSFDYPGGTGPLFKIAHGVFRPFGVAVSPATQ